MRMHDPLILVHTEGGYFSPSILWIHAQSDKVLS